MIRFVTKHYHHEPGTVTITVPSAFAGAWGAMQERSNRLNAGYLTVTLELPHRPRSTGFKSQNHHLRGHVRQLCFYTGYTMTEMMDVIKQATPTWPEKIMEIRGRHVAVKASEADVSVEVASEAIEICHVIAADHDWYLKEE